MTKKHLIRLAEYVRDTGNYCDAFTPGQIDHLANFCHEMNPMFKRQRWLGYIRGENGSNGGAIVSGGAVARDVEHRTNNKPKRKT